MPVWAGWCPLLQPAVARFPWQRMREKQEVHILLLPLRCVPRASLRQEVPGLLGEGLHTHCNRAIPIAPSVVTTTVARSTCLDRWRACIAGADGMACIAGADGRACAAGVDGTACTAGVDGRACTAGADGRACTAGADGRACEAGACAAAAGGCCTVDLRGFTSVCGCSCSSSSSGCLAAAVPRPGAAPEPLVGPVASQQQLAVLPCVTQEVQPKTC